MRIVCKNSPVWNVLEEGFAYFVFFCKSVTTNYIFNELIEDARKY